MQKQQRISQIPPRAFIKDIRVGHCNGASSKPHLMHLIQFSVLLLHVYTYIDGLKWYLRFLFTVPPESPVIVNEGGREATSQLGPYNEGATVQISCEVSRGKFNRISLWYTYIVIEN